MKQSTLIAVSGAFTVLLIVPCLQAQPPASLDEPVDPSAVSSPDAPAVQPGSATATQNPGPYKPELTLQPGAGQKVQEQQVPAKIYPIWILIKPDGVQFLQTQEEIATHQNAIPPNAFLLGCMTVKFEGAAGEQNPDFQLNCEDFLLMGRFGTKQNLDVKGASLSYSTHSQQMRLKGTDELPLEYRSVDAASETRMRAGEITLQLDAGPKTVTRFELMTYKDAKTGQQKTAHVPVTKQIAEGSSFQLSAQNITALEMIAVPATKDSQSADGDVSIGDPRPRDSDVPFYEPAREENKFPTY